MGNVKQSVVVNVHTGTRTGQPKRKRTRSRRKVQGSSDTSRAANAKSYANTTFAQPEPRRFQTYTQLAMPPRELEGYTHSGHSLTQILDNQKANHESLIDNMHKAFSGLHNNDEVKQDIEGIRKTIGHGIQMFNELKGNVNDLARPRQLFTPEPKRSPLHETTPKPTPRPPLSSFRPPAPPTTVMSTAATPTASQHIDMLTPPHRILTPPNFQEMKAPPSAPALQPINTTPGSIAARSVVAPRERKQKAPPVFPMILEQQKKTRKPRADKGKPRGQYKKKDYADYTE